MVVCHVMCHGNVKNLQCMDNVVFDGDFSYQYTQAYILFTVSHLAEYVVNSQCQNYFFEGIQFRKCFQCCKPNTKGYHL